MNGSKMATQSCSLRRLILSAWLLVGFALGMACNYYGLLFEVIRLEVNVDITNASTSPNRFLAKLLPSVEWREISDNGGNVLSDPYIVPNIIHFIWLMEESETKELSFLNYLSILSADRIHKPEVIMLHCNRLPVGKWWEMIRREVSVTIAFRDAPLAITDRKILHAQHRRDVIKMEVLLNYGGIYLANDVIVINRLDGMRVSDFTFGEEKSGNLVDRVMAAAKNSKSLESLYEAYRSNYQPWNADYSCVLVSLQLTIERSDLHFEPFQLQPNEHQQGRGLTRRAKIDWRGFYVVHVTSEASGGVDYTPDSIKRLNSIPGQATRLIYYGSSDVITPSG